MKTAAVIGADGFVGSAFVRHLSGLQIDVEPITRANYPSLVGRDFDLVVDAAANSKKFLADEDPRADFELTALHRLRTLLDFPNAFHLHISSVDVYSDLDSPELTREDTAIDRSRCSRYGFHKLISEDLVRYYAKEWLVVRLAGMVGSGLRKNPVYDLLHEIPIRIHPDSQYQFLSTDDAARIAISLVSMGRSGEAFNVCGDGLISPREIADLACVSLDLSLVDDEAKPRIVMANLDKLKSVTAVPETRSTIGAFLVEQSRARA